VRCTFTTACNALALALGMAAGDGPHAATTAPAAAFRPPYVPASDDERLQEVPSVADPAWQTCASCARDSMPRRPACRPHSNLPMPMSNTADKSVMPISPAMPKR